MSRPFTPSQRAAIDARGTDLIVSAGAGAGKTATLVERVFALLTDPRDPVDIGDFLIVTFTKAAAQEMKSRLHARLQGELRREGLDPAVRERLEQQVFALPRASISTLHSLCLDIIAQYPRECGLPPGFQIISEEEARLVRRDFLQRKIEKALAPDSPDRDAVQRLLLDFDVLNGAEAVLEQFARFMDFVQSLPDPQRIEQLNAGLYGEDRTAYRRLLGDWIADQAAPVLAMIDAAVRAAGKGLHPKLRDDAGKVAAVAEAIRAALAPGGDAAALALRWDAIAFDRMPPVREADRTPADDEYRAARTEAKDAAKKLGERLAAFDPTRGEAELCAGRGIAEFLAVRIGRDWCDELFEHHRAMRRITFAHLERLALRLLAGGDPAAAGIAAQLAGRYRAVLVDEFQDINEVQERLLAALAGGGSRLFAVGDVKQSIYEFRQANPSIFLRWFGEATDAQQPGRRHRIALRENFRSAPEYLRELNSLFARILRSDTIGADYSQGHAFVPGRASDRSGRRPALGITILDKEGAEPADGGEDDFGAEAIRVGDLIASLGPPWRDICILLRSTVGTARELMRVLEQRGIPAFTDSRTTFLTATEVVEFQALLKAIHNPYDEVSLLGALRGPAARWPADDLLRLRMVDRRGMFFDNLRAAAADPDHPLRDQADRFLSHHARWQSMASRLPMAELFASLYDELDLLERVAVQAGGDQRRLNLLHLANKAAQFDSFLRKGLGEFLSFLEDLIDNEQDFGAPSPAGAEADVVRIMTIHQSKGMEFPIVVVPFLGRQFNESNLRAPFLYDKDLGVAPRMRDDGTRAETAPPYYELFRNQRRKKERAEELRLLYVALTRAEEAAYLLGSVRGLAARWEQAVGNASRPPSGPDILAARTPLSWVVDWAAARFPSLSAAGNASAAEGIVSIDLVVQAQPREATEPRGPEAEAPVDPRLASEIAAATDRVVALLRRKPPVHVRAKVSVSEAKRAFDALREPETPPYPTPSRAPSWMPASLASAEPAVGGVRRGTATHRFLALADLVAISAGSARPAAERDRLVQEGMLSPDEAAAIPMKEVVDFLNSPLGKRLRLCAGSAHRERAFTAALAGSEIGAPHLKDPIILQGAVDVLFREQGRAGWVLVDYKTDNTGARGERLEELRAAYEPQIQLYRLLVERALGEEVREAWLVFLHAGEHIEIPAGDGAIAWQTVASAGVLIVDEPQQRRIAGPSL